MIDPTEHRLPFQIPKAFDVYNHYIGGVEFAAQYRPYYKTKRREKQN